MRALAELTGASSITIRRDLAELEQVGIITRTHGGAVLAPQRGDPMPFSLRQSEETQLKRALAACTAGLVADDESLVIDNGTTCVEVARALAGRRITALCLSLHAAAALAERPGATVVVPDGVVQTDTLQTEPSQAMAAVRDMLVDTVILGACSASPIDGLTSVHHTEAQLKRACIAAARRRILVISATKLTRTSTFRFADIGELTQLVTTDTAPTDLLDEYRAAGVEVILAPAPKR